MNFEKLVGSQVFKKPQLLSNLIFFKFVHLFLLLYLLRYLYLLSMFLVAITQFGGSSYYLNRHWVRQAAAREAHSLVVTAWISVR